ncbi:MAG: M23 family metallopeptidase [Burkholderiaceae bacterium]|nr:MAG: M23 family metallopeptidase [Burkholderiaceae bacterium]
MGSFLLKNHVLAVGKAFAGLIHRHPRRVSAVVAALLLGGGGGAFAVASFGPDPSDLPTHQILEAVQPLAAPPEQQADALDFHHFRLYRSDTTRSSDSAQALLKRLGIEDAGAAAFIRKDLNARQGLLGRAGRSVSAEATDSHELLKLTARWTTDTSGNFQRLVIQKTAQGFSSQVETAPLTASTRLGSATITSSLVAGADTAGIPDGVISQIVDIFSGDIDFHGGLHKGDRFSVVYQTLEADGEPISGANITGRVLSVEFVNKGKEFRAMWFQDPTASGAAGKGSYYTLDGRSLHHAYLKSPVEFTHITSGFSMRYHPILHIWKKHLGVDYAGPIGTPVRTVADGVVEFAGVQSGYGNVIYVLHRPGPDGSHMTVYAHLSKILVRKGESVSQGQNIGLIGETGWATGPHLHFEYRVNGVYEDPVMIAQQNDTPPLSAAARPAFDRLASSMRLQLAAAASVQQASAQ